MDAIGASGLDGALFSKHFSKPNRQDAVIPPEKAEVLAGARQKPKQLKKLENKVKWKFYRDLGELQPFDFSHRTDHFQVTVDKCGADGKGVEDHFWLKSKTR